MPTQKTFKRRIRARSEKTGESYTAARAQLIRRAGTRAEPPAEDERQPQPQSRAVEMPTSEDALLRATGHNWDHWFGVLDAWGARERSHTEMARWLREERGVDGWWAQAITVGYERARGMRAMGQVASGFVVNVSRTIAAPVDRLEAAFTEPSLRRRWLPDASLRRRPTRAEATARFDWPDPKSILVAWFIDKGNGKSSVAVSHERLPDEATAQRLKPFWRARLGALKELLEGG